MGLSRANFAEQQTQQRRLPRAVPGYSDAVASHGPERNRHDHASPPGCFARGGFEHQPRRAHTAFGAQPAVAARRVGQRHVPSTSSSRNGFCLYFSSPGFYACRTTPLSVRGAYQLSVSRRFIRQPLSFLRMKVA
jgi:hypothetical protein